MAIHIGRREFIVTLGSAAAAWSRAARAQQPKKIPRLCFLTFDPGTPQSPAKRFEAFFERLRELGYVNGETSTIDYLHPEGERSVSRTRG
jgi:putative ABC transport system substrate-binding protein